MKANAVMKAKALKRVASDGCDLDGVTTTGVGEEALIGEGRRYAREIHRGIG